MSAPPRLVRFLADVQRRPVAAIVSVVVTILLLGLAFRELETDDAGFAWVFVSTCLATASAEIGARATSLWARLVIVGLGAGSTWPVIALVLPHAKDDLWLFALVALMIAVPHALASATGRTRRTTHGLLATGLAIAAAALPVLAEGMRTSNRDAGIACLLLWVLAVQTAFLAAARSSVSHAAIAWSAVALGVASGAERMLVESKLSEVSEAARWMGGAWFVCALLVPLARLGGSFTAVPDDHPVRADFGRLRAA